MTSALPSSVCGCGVGVSVGLGGGGRGERGSACVSGWEAWSMAEPRYRALQRPWGIETVEGGE